MFSGIVEETGFVTAARTNDGIVRIQVQRPASFTDIKRGDSICVNGVCLTVEEMSGELLQFSLAPETLKITGWTAESVVGRMVNLERSLRLSDRLHGHLVTGHVDAAGTVTFISRNGESQDVTIEHPDNLAPFIWAKGSVAVNGVSLTLNRVEPNHFTVGLIPETLKRTNLGNLSVGAGVNLEADNWARGLVHQAKLVRESQT